MTKKELVEAVASQTGLSRKDAEAAIDATFDLVAEETISSGTCRVYGFGSFKKVVRAERHIVNPTTHKVVDVPEKKTVVFKPADGLKARLG